MWSAALLAGLAGWSAAPSPPVLPVAAVAAVAAFETATEDPPWREGGLAELLAAAAEERRPLLVHLWVDDCAGCDRLRDESLSAPAVLEALGAFVAASWDGASGAGLEVVRRYEVGAFPALLVLESDGRVRDLLKGFAPPDALAQELRRIARDEGTLSALALRVRWSPDDLALRYELATRYAALGLRAARAEQVAEIHRRDPEGTSIFSRRLRLAEAIAVLRAERDGAPLLAVLRRESAPELLHEGWFWIFRLEFERREEAHAAGDAEAVRLHRERALAALRTCWETTPEERVCHVGKIVASAHLALREELGPEDWRFACSVARSAVERRPKDAAAAAYLSRCLEGLGDREGARAWMERAAELAPDEPAYGAELEERFGAAKGGY